MKVEFYRDRNKRWRWRIKARNGRIVANSAGDGYNRKFFALREYDKIRLFFLEESK